MRSSFVPNFCVLLAVCIGTGKSHQLKPVVSEEDREKWMHPTHDYSKYRDTKQNLDLEDANYWNNDAQNRLKSKLQVKRVEGVAKNVIFNLGDGMSVPTITAARVFKGQKVDSLPFGEEAELYMDTLPFTGTSKTFCSDSQVADSACSATAYLCGVKANDGTIGVTSDVLRRSCEGQANKANHVSSALAWAQSVGKSTGIVTTTRVTHASPSGAYAHIANRDWENDGAIALDGQDPTLCDDIAKQLVLSDPGQKINVILGGGRQHFTPTTLADPEFNTTFGYRQDGQNLIETWISKNSGRKGSYVSGRDQLLNINTAETDYLLGLFNPSHVAYWDLQTAQNDPSLEEMVQVAIEILSKNPNGFFLFVEGGRIDHAHHDNMIHRSLRETVEFDKAIKKGDDLTRDAETLIVVTSDHAHAMHFAGYPDRGNPILKYQLDISDVNDNLPYSTLGYANGPGPSWIDPETGERRNISSDNVEDPTYQPPSPVPMASETHGGDDVLIFAKGPYAHLLTGVHQQSYIPHVVGYAACMGDGAKSEYCPNSAISSKIPGLIILLSLLTLIFNL